MCITRVNVLSSKKFIVDESTKKVECLYRSHNHTIILNRLLGEEHNMELGVQNSLFAQVSTAHTPSLGLPEIQSVIRI